jgi:hypothetical protein
MDFVAKAHDLAVQRVVDLRLAPFLEQLALRVM